MRNAESTGTRRRRGDRKPYVQPKLMVHGDIRTLTRAKKGTTNDGFGKPRTRRSIFNA